MERVMREYCSEECRRVRVEPKKRQKTIIHYEYKY